MNISEFEKMFESSYYSPAYRRWRIEAEKAPKDIVGEQYEIFRRDFYRNLGLTVSDGTKALGGNYNADLVVKNNNGEAIIVEEAKAHYVDRCFLERAMQDAAKMFNHCLKNEIEPPYFVLSCPTKYNGFEKCFNEMLEIINPKLVRLFKTKFVYLPLCNHNRVVANKYFRNEISCFNLNGRLVENQIRFARSLDN